MKLVHSSYIFLQEVAGIEDKLTDSAMYAVSLKELMSQAAPGRSPRQAPRFPTILLAAFEEMVLAGDKPVFLRVLSWWLLVQSWGTMRFDDHRGLLPCDVNISAAGMQAKLTRTKVSGSDKHLNFRTVIIAPSAYVQYKDWLAVGLGSVAERCTSRTRLFINQGTEVFDGLRSADTHHLDGSFVVCQCSSARQGITTRRTAAGILCHRQPLYWGLAKLSVIYLETGPAEGSQRYTRTAKFQIAQMQTAVAATFRSLEPDQLAESDDIDALADFLRSWDVPEVSIRKSLKILCLRSYADLERSDSVEPPPADCDVVPSELLLDDFDEKAEAQKKLSKEKAASRQQRPIRTSRIRPQASSFGNPLTVTRRVLYFALWEEGYSSGSPFGTLLHAAWG